MQGRHFQAGGVPRAAGVVRSAHRAAGSAHYVFVSGRSVLNDADRLADERARRRS